MYFVRVSYIQTNRFTQLCNYALQYASFIQESRSVFFLSECIAELQPGLYVCTCKEVVKKSSGQFIGLFVMSH
jgi:hypothetical protein